MREKAGNIVDALAHWGTVIDWRDRKWVPLDDAERVRRSGERLLTDALERTAELEEARRELRGAVQALEYIAEHARLDHAERGIGEAERYALLAEKALRDLGGQ